MRKRQFLIAYKLFFAALVFITVTAQLYHSIPKTGFSYANFFSYFTIQSNLFAAVTLLVTADLLFWKRKRNHEQEMLRGAATLYMVTTGIIYGLLLAHINVQITLPWVNDVLHRIMPLVMLFDWLYDKPARKITARQSLLWLIFPAVYVVYTLLRGPHIHDWYPYPFLNPAEHGYFMVAINCITIGVVVYGLAQIIRLLPKWTKAPGG